LNDRIYPKSAAPVTVSTFVIIYFRFWKPITVEGVQIGQDRDFTDRKFNGEVALLALYARRFCESEIGNNIKSIANSYQIALPDVFPYQGSKADARTIGKRILSDGQDEPVTRVKRGARTMFDLAFTGRHQNERLAAAAFWDEFYPSKRFIYRDYENIPPADTIVRLPENSQFQWNGGQTVNQNSYGFQVFESVIAPATAIPPAPTIPTESPDTIEVPDTEAPTVPGTPSLSVISTSQINGSFTASSDNVAVTHYRLRRATNSGFTTGVVDTDLGTSTSFNATGLSASTQYWFKVLAEDAAGNQSAYSASANATTTASDTEAPSTPTSFTLDTENLPTSSTVGLTWLGSSDNVAVTEYQVQYATNSGFTTGVGTQDFSPVGGPGDDEPHIVMGLSPSTTYYFRVRAKDAAGNYSSYTSSVNTMTEAAGGYDPVTALGSKLIVYLDAEQIAGANGDPVTTIPNTGTENDWSKIDGTVTLAVESGKKAINIAAGGRLQGGSTTPALSTWTFYAVVKMVTDPTENHYVLLTHIFSGSKAIIVGFVDNKFEYYDTPRTEIGNASTGSYQLIKCTVGTTANGQWLLAGQMDVAFKFRAVIGCNDSLSGGEESALETWLATRL
jgi:chitodextrinase